MKNPHLFQSVLVVLCLLVATPSFSNVLTKENVTTNFTVSTITSFSPSDGYAGTIVTILGSDFTSSSIVKIGTTLIPTSNVTFVSTSELQVVIPCDTTTGLIEVDGTVSATSFTYKPAAITSLVEDLSYCVGTTVPELILGGSDPTVTFSWTSSNSAIGLATTGSGNVVTFTAANPNLEPINSLIQITPSINGCAGAVKTYSINVNPKPIANSISDITVCEGTTVNDIALTASSPLSGSGTSFKWTATNALAIGMAVSTGNTSPIPSFVSKNLTNGILSSRIDVQPIFKGCIGNTTSFFIKVEPETVAGTLSGNTTICSGSVAGNLTLNNQVGSVVKWQSSTDASVWNDIVATSTVFSPGVLTQSTYFRAVVKSGSCLEASTAPYLISVNNLPTVNAGVDQTICAGTSVILAGSGATSYTWNNAVVNNTSFVPSTTTTYTVTGTAANGCSATDQVLVTVNPIPAAPSAIAQTFLSSQNATVGSLIITSAGVPTWYNSVTGGTTYSTSSLLNSGTYYASQKINGCESTSRTSVVVSVFADSVGGNVSGTTSVCSGTNATTLTLSGHTGNVQKWQSSTVNDFSSNVNDIAVTTTSLIVTNISTPKYYRAVVQSGASTSFSAPAFIDVVAVSNGGNLVAINSGVCKDVVGGAINLSGQVGDVVRWQESTNNGTSWTDIANTSVSFNAPALSQTTQYRVEVKNGICNASFSNIVTILVKNTPTVTDIPDQEICLGSTKVFGDTFVTGNSYSLTSNSGFSSTLNQTSVTFNTVGTQIFTYAITNAASGCSVQDQFQVITNDLPLAKVISNTTICESTSVDLGFSAILGNIYNWTSSPAGFTSTISNPSVSPAATTTYILEEKNTATGCIKTNSVKITILPKPIISFSTGPDVSICDVTVNKPIIATISNTYSAFNWEIIPSDGGSLTNANTLNPQFTPSATGIANGSVIVRLNVTGLNPCNTIVSKEIKFTIDKTTVDLGADQIICEGLFTVPAVVTNGGSISWTHNGNGFFVFFTAFTASPIYVSSALDRDHLVTFTATVTPKNGCGSNATDSVIYKINGAPQINAGSNTTVCESQLSHSLNATTSFTDSLSWTHDGSGTLDNPYTEDPTYTISPNDITKGSVTFTLKGKKVGCTDASGMVTLTIRKNPIANAGSAQTICQGQTVYFSGTAPNADSVSWSKSTGSGVFNNPNTLTPNYVSSINDAGTITFTLTAQPDVPYCNSPSVSTTTVTIIPKPIASIGVVNPQICEGSAYTVNSALASNYDSLEWTASSIGGSFIGGNTLTPTYIPGANDSNTGSVKLTLTAKKNTPCIEDAIAELTLIINKIPKVTVVTASEDVCTDAGVAVPITGSAANFGVVASDFDTLSWTTSGSGSFTTSNPSNTTSANSYIPSSGDLSNGSVILTLTASRTPINCNSTKSNTILLNFIKKPQANAGVDTTICENTTYISTTATAANFSSIVWSSNGSAGTISNPNSLNGMVYTPSAADIANGSVTLTLTAIGNSCHAPFKDDIIISFEKLPIISTLTSASVCKSANQFAISGTTITNNFLANSIQWTSSGTGSFTTTTDPKNPIYLPSNADKANGSVTLTISVKPVTPCLTLESKSFVLTFIPEPVASAGTNLTKCDLPFTITTATATMSTINGLKWTTSGTGTFDVDNTINPTYTPSNVDNTNGSVVLKLTASPISPCSVPNESTILVTIVKSPTVNVVSPQASICEDATNVVVTGTTIQNAAAIHWTSATPTTISNSSSLSPLVTPSAADIANGFIELTVSATPNAPCSAAVTKTVRIPVQQKPKVNAGVSQTICQGNVITTSDAVTTQVTNIQWTNNGGDGTFTTPINSRVVEYTPGPNEIASGTVLLTLTADAIAPCVGTVTSTIQHFITKNPVITINPTEVSICENQTYQVPLSQVNVVNPSSVATVNWSTTTASSLTGSTTFTPIYTPTAADIAAGFATLTLTVTPISPCANPIVKTLKVNISKKATIDATQTNYSFCENTPKQLSAIFANHDTSSIHWRIVSGAGTLTGINTATPIYTPDTSSNTVIIEVTAASISPCNAITNQQFVLNVIKKPLLSVSKTTDTICNTQTSYALNGNSVSPSTANTSFLWTTTGTGTFTNNTSLNSTYIFSAADLASNLVTLKLQAQSDALCALTDSKEIKITIKPAPTVSTVATEALCEGSIFTATALATNETSVLWTTVGTSNGTFANANSKTAFYTPGTNDTNGFTLQFTATGNAVCASSSANKTVNIQKKPQIDAGMEARHSCASESFTITGVSATNVGTITWSSSSVTGVNKGTFSNPSALNPIYTPSAAEVANGSPITLTATATAVSPCTDSVSDFIILSLDPKQQVNAGVDQTICESSSVTLTGAVSHTSSVQWTSSGTGSFVNANQASTTYIPSNSDILTGSVILTLHGISDTNCAEVTDNLLVSILKKPTVNAGSAVSICEGLPYTLVNGDASANDYSLLTWTATGPGTLDAGTINGLNPTYNPATGQTGDVVLTLTAKGIGACSMQVNSTKTITIVPKPIVTAPSARTICQGQNLDITAGEASASHFSALAWTASNSLGSFAPNNAITTTYTPTATQSGTMNLRLTATALNSVCANASADIAVTIVPKPIVNAGLDASICETSTHTISGASVPSGSLFEWSVAGAGTIQAGTENSLTPIVVPNVGTSGAITLTLTVQGTTQCPATVSDSVIVTVFPKPTVDAGTDLTACEGVAFIALNGTASNGANYTWTSDGTGTIQASTNPLQAKYIPSASDYASNAVNTIHFFLTASGTNGCSQVIDSATATLYAKPQVFAGVDLTACQGNTASITTATASRFNSINWTSSGNGTFDYTASNGGINPKYTLGSTDLSSVTLTVSVMPNAHCAQVAVTDQMVISVNKNPSIQASSNEITMCGESFTLPDLITVLNASAISWTNTTGLATVGAITNSASETPIVTPTVDEIANGFITLKVVAQPLAQCSATAEQIIKVNLKSKVIANAGTDLVVCQGSSVVLNNGATTTATTYFWTENGAGSIKPSTANTLFPEYLPSASESGVVTLTLHATNPSPCLGEVTDTMTITINPLPTVNVGADATICETSSFSLVNTQATNFENNNSNLEWVAYQDANGITVSTGTFTDIHSLNPTFTPSTTDIVTGKVYLSLKVTSPSCSTVVSDSLELTIAPGIGVNAGVNASICEGSSFNLTQATADNSASVSWISAQNSSGTSNVGYIAGSFSNANQLNPSYTPSADDLNLGFVYLKLTGISNSTCPSNSSIIRLDIVKKPKISVSDVQMCVTTPQINLSATATDYQSVSWSIQSGPGSIVTNSGAPLNPTYISGLSATETNNKTAVVRLLANPKAGCPFTAAVFKDINVTIQGLPAVEAGLNGATCYISGQPIAAYAISGTTVSNGGSQNWTTSAAGNFTLGNPVLYNSFSNSCTAEVLTLTVNGLGACSSSTNSDALNLTINCAIPNLGAITSSTGSTICQSESATITYTVPVNSIVGSYNWTVPSGATIVSGQNTNTIAVRYGIGSVSGNVSVYGSNGCGNGAISTFAVTINALPTATSISGQQAVCVGTSGVVYSALAIPGATSYSWTLVDGTTILTASNSITVNYQPTDVSGNITVKANNACGSGPISPDFPITIVAKPSLTSSLTPTAICSDTVFGYIPTASMTGTSFSWTRAVQSGISNPAASANGNINEVLLNTTSNPISVVYQYTLTGAAPTACTTVATVTVSVKPIPTLTSSSAAVSICSGTTFTYTPTSATAGTISWSRATVAGITESASSGTSSISEPLTNTTALPVTVIYKIDLPVNSAGCTKSIDIPVTVNPIPKASISGNASVCHNTSSPTVTFTGTNGTAPYTFTYTINGGTNQTLITTTGESATLSALTSNVGTSVYALVSVKDASATACSQLQTGTATVVVNPIPLVVINQPLPVCAPNTVDITTTTTNSDSGLNYTFWTDAQNTLSFSSPTAATTGTYYIKGTNTFGCSDSKAVSVVVNPLPTATIAGTTAVCKNSASPNITFTGNGGTTPYTFSYTINGGAIQTISTVSNNTSVSIQAPTTVAGVFNYNLVSIQDASTSACSQAQTGTATVTVNPLPQASITGTTSVCNNATNPVVTFTGSNGTAPYTFTYSINGGANQTITSSGNSVTLTVPTANVGIFTYDLISVKDSSSTACTQLQSGSAVVTVNPLPSLLITNPAEVCLPNTVDITNTTSGSSVGLTYTYWNDNATTIALASPGAIATSGTYFIKGTDANGCFNVKPVPVKINPLPQATISGLNNYTVCKNETQPLITFKGSNATPPYVFHYRIDSGAVQTVATTGTNDFVSIAIPTTTVGTFTIKLLDVQESSLSNCGNTIITSPSEAYVNVQQGGTILPQNPVTVSQIVCQKSAMIPAVFKIGGSATSAFVTNLPAGINGNYNTATKTLTISGSPTASGIFNYVIHTAGSVNGCDSTYSGTLTVNANDTITVVTPTTVNQNVCACSAIKPIAYSLGGGATGGDVVFSPNAPTGIIWSIASNVLTISGTSCELGTFTYTVRSYGICDPTTYSGIIQINDNATVSVVSGNPNTTVCVGTSFATPIKFKIVPTTATMSLNGTLPTGVTFSPLTGILSGTPTQSGTFPYTISSSTSCGVSVAGTITVNAAQSISLLSGNTQQIACINNPMDPIQFTVAEGVSSVVVSPSLPAGITAILDTTTKIVTISGTPTVATSLPQNYNITTQGGCGAAANATINLDIKPAATITFISDAASLNQAVCLNGPISPIQFKVGGGATGIVAPNLPNGLKISQDSSTGIYTIQGNPTVNGTFTIPITTTGCTLTQNISVSNVNSVVSISLASVAGTDNQKLCQTNFNTPITPVKYTIVGATSVNVTGLPAGIAATYSASTGTLDISGTPTEAGVFNYTITSLPCSFVKTGVMKISTPIFITNEKVTDVSCGSTNNGSIAVTIIGGVAVNGQYGIQWTAANGYQNNLATITGLAPDDYTIRGTDAIGCPLPSKTYTVLPATSIQIALLSTSNVSCNGKLGCANFNFTGGSGIYSQFKLQYLDASSQSLLTVVPPNNNYYNICNLKAGLYYLTVTDSNNCATEPYLFTIYDYSTLNIDKISLDENLCNNSSGKIRITMSSLDTNLTFYYNNVIVPSVALGDNVYELSINTPTSPTGIVKVINQQNCWDTETITTAITNPTVEYTSLNLTTYGSITVNESIKFTNGLTTSTIPTEYDYLVWDFGDNSPYKVFYNPKDKNPNSAGESVTTVFHSYAIDGLYPVTLTVYNKFGCSKSISKIITVGAGAKIMLPTAFSPNNDGINDLFRPSLLGLKEVSMYIYDNWGNLVYEISSETATLPTDWGWNGIEKVNTEPMNGTYRYYIQAKTINDTVIEKEGQFILIK